MDKSYFKLLLTGGVDDWMTQIASQGFRAEKFFLIPLVEHVARARRLKFAELVTDKELERIEKRIFRKVLNHVTILN